MKSICQVSARWRWRCHGLLRLSAVTSAILAFSLGEAAKAFNEFLEPFKETKDSLDVLGVFERSARSRM
ncbi:MAG: hypothetical protein JO004_00685, partial [Methylobacteriaceae bacterium]|nr:hypothetical protein [Methylobacteriaceae bacterium]